MLFERILNFMHCSYVCGLQLNLKPGGRLHVQVRRFSESGKTIRLALRAALIARILLSFSLLLVLLEAEY